MGSSSQKIYYILKQDHKFLETVNFDNFFAANESLYEKPSLSPMSKFWKF